MMGTIKRSKDQDLVAGDLRVDSKGKKKAKNPPDQIHKTKREFMHWLLAHQAHLVSSLILELPDI